MKIKILFVSLLSTALVSTVFAQDTKAFLGRWDMTVTPTTGKPYPQWIEVTENGGTLSGRVQPRGGAWHPFTGAHVEAGKLIVPVGDTNGTAIVWELTSPVANTLAGVGEAWAMPRGLCSLASRRLRSIGQRPRSGLHPGLSSMART